MIMDNRFLVARRRYDPDATRYINAVQLADGQALEPEVAMAVNAFVRGCKADGIWDAIKASCLLCGPRTLSGALVPLRGDAPTGYNFASGDYDREAGIVGRGDPGGSYISVGVGSAQLLQDDNHVSVYLTANATDLNTNPWIGDPYTGGGRLRLQDYDNEFYTWNYMATNLNMGPVSTGFTGCARSEPTAAVFRSGGSYNNYASASVAGVFTDLHFLRSGNNRMAFFSAGTALDLAALDTRISAYVASIAAAL